MDIRWAPGFSLSQALDMLEEDDDIAAQLDEIFIEPPNISVETDEDSASEDEGGMVCNLTGRQLRVPAEIRLVDNQRLGVNATFSDDESELPPSTEAAMPPVDDAMPSTSTQTVDEKDEWIRDNLRKKADFEWIHGDLEPSTRPFPPANYARYESMSCVEIFEIFFDDETVEYLVQETQRYAHFLNQNDPKITALEIRCFLGILILSGYNDLPSKRLYWDMQEDVKNTLVSNAMRRNRFLQIQKFLHFADNTMPSDSDKAWKIRPLLDLIKKKCLDNFVPSQSLAFDESMIRYYGRHGCKQFIRGKPIRFGYKMWCLNTNDGYLLNFDLYQGKNPRGVDHYDTLFGKAASPLVLMLDQLQNKDLPYNIYMDNLFSGMTLFSYLRTLGYGAVGTIRENRVPRNCPITDKKRFLKKNRGEMQHYLERNSGILLVRWMENSVVTILSTSGGVMPIGNVKRYSQKERKNIMVARPNCIAKYNNNMGGTDLMDQGVSQYSVGIRAKKWYWPIITWLLDVAIMNSWFLYRQNHKDTPLLKFRREIAQIYLKRYAELPKGPGRIKLSRNVLPNLRFDGMNHLVISCNRRRCAGDGCKSFGRTMCQKCNFGLCVPCFVKYHTR